AEGNMIPIIQHGMKSHPELDKLGVPQIYKYITADRVQAPYTVEQVRQLFDLTYAAKTMGRPFAMGPGVPAERVKAIRTAFNNMSKDPKFLADADKQKRDIFLVTGDEIQGIVNQMAATPKATLNLLEEVQTYKGKAKVAKVEMAKHTGKVTATKRGGRRIIIDYKGKNVTAKVSGSRTTVTINGQKTKRKNVKVGMTCTFIYPGAGMEAKRVDCKG
ncbi:MAG: hypothetical protein R3229_17060, partial [Alphaproteobacteria bacterium]|nr:hypothetical protein [Alphaproteobacteria bacterium]